MLKRAPFCLPPLGRNWCLLLPNVNQSLNGVVPRKRQPHVMAHPRRAVPKRVAPKKFWKVSTAIFKHYLLSNPQHSKTLYLSFSLHDLLLRNTFVWTLSNNWIRNRTLILSTFSVNGGDFGCCGNHSQDYFLYPPQILTPTYTYHHRHHTNTYNKNFLLILYQIIFC